MKTKLDKDEKEIEKDAEAYRSISMKERSKIEGVIDRIRKTRNVNIRISEAVLEELKHDQEKKEFLTKHLSPVCFTSS